MLFNIISDQDSQSKTSHMREGFLKRSPQSSCLHSTAHDRSCPESSLVTLGNSWQLARKPGFSRNSMELHAINSGIPMPSCRRDVIFCHFRRPCPFAVHHHCGHWMVTVVTETSWHRGRSVLFLKKAVSPLIQPGLSKARSLPVLLPTPEWSRPATLSHRDTVSFAFAELLHNAYVCPGSWFRKKLLHPKDSLLPLFSYVGKDFPALVLPYGLQLLRR